MARLGMALHTTADWVTVIHRSAVASLLLSSLSALVLTPLAAAQQTASDNPDALRPPSFLAYPPVSRQQAIVRLYFAELTMALQSGDTTTLTALVPDSVIPAAEKVSARRAGCASLGTAMAQARAGATAQSLNSLAFNEIEVTPAGQGDTVALAAGQLAPSAGGSLVSVALTRHGHARRMARVKGLLLAVCALRG